MSLLKMMKIGFVQIILFALIMLTGLSCTSMKKNLMGAKNSIVTSVKETFQGTKNSIISIAKKSPIVRNDKDQDFLFAQHQFNRRDFSVVEFYLKKALANHPGDMRALNLLPWTYFFQKRFDKAIIAFSKTHTFNKKNPIPIIGMAWCYFSLKHYENA